MKKNLLLSLSLLSSPVIWPAQPAELSLEDRKQRIRDLEKRTVLEAKDLR